MEEKKKKNLGAPRLTTIPFLLVWIIGHIIVWVGLYWASRILGYPYPDWMMILAFGLIMGVGLALMQKMLIQFTYRDTLKWWMVATIGSWVVAWGFFYFYVEWMDKIGGWVEDSLSLMLLPLFIIPAAVQWFILRRNTRHAWLWIAAGAASAMAFGALYGNINDNDMIQFIFGASAQGAVTGLSLLWLYGQSRVEKIKTGA